MAENPAYCTNAPDCAASRTSTDDSRAARKLSTRRGVLRPTRALKMPTPTSSAARWSGSAGARSCTNSSQMSSGDHPPEPLLPGLAVPPTLTTRSLVTSQDTDGISNGERANGFVGSISGPRPYNAVSSFQQTSSDPNSPDRRQSGRWRRDQDNIRSSRAS